MLNLLSLVLKLLTYPSVLAISKHQGYRESNVKYIVILLPTIKFTNLFG